MSKNIIAILIRIFGGLIFAYSIFFLIKPYVPVKVTLGLILLFVGWEIVRVGEKYKRNKKQE